MRRRSLLASIAASAIAGCGFELRRPPELPVRSIALIGFAPRSPLQDELRRALRASGTQLVDLPAKAEAVLQAFTDTREKAVVASTSAGQVRELQLRVRLGFRVSTPSGRVLLPPSELLLTRDMSYTETAALAKEQEEAELYRAMEADIVAQVLRRLSAVKVPAA